MQCNNCAVEISYDSDTRRMVEVQTERVHTCKRKPRETEGWCSVCQIHFSDYNRGFIHMIQYYGHPLVPFNLDKPETLAGAIVAGVPVRLTR